MSDISDDDRSRKRRKTTQEDGNTRALPNSLTATVSPPPLRRRKQEVVNSTQDSDTESRKELPGRQDKVPITKPHNGEGQSIVESPFQLTWIRDLPESSNVDAITLKDIIGDPLISECWEFNYMHNVDFLMSHFDPDVRDLVKVHIVHGFWQDEHKSKHTIKVGHRQEIVD
jgi:tyrosyl-DNA phosphodiesterase-1